jgi:ribosomal protein S18 acetylase RimI-like enzyme
MVPTRLRKAREQDARQIAMIHVNSWRAAYAGLLPDDVLARLSVEKRTEFWAETLAKPPEEGRETSTWVVERTGPFPALIGFSFVGPTRDSDLDPRLYSEIYAFYLDPEAWRQGFGTVLMDHSLRQLRAMGFREFTLWALAENDRATHFYTSAGFTRDGSRKLESFGDAHLEEVRYRWRAPPARPKPPRAPITKP